MLSADLRMLDYAIALRENQSNIRLPSVSICSSKLGGWLFKNRLQLLEVNRLNQVKMESSFFRTSNVLLGAETGERNCLDVAFRTHLCCDFVAASIGQTEVTQHYVDVIRA